MILMPVIAVVGKHKFRIELRPDFFKPILDCRPFAWEVALTEGSDLHLSASYATQKFIRAPAGFISTLPWRAENNPADFQVGNLFHKLEQRAADPDLDIVRVSTQT